MCIFYGDSSWQVTKLRLKPPSNAPRRERIFWLSLVPFITEWMGENHRAPLPTAIYGAVMLLAAIAYTILTRAIVVEEGPESKLAAAVGKDRKGMISLALYAATIPLSFVNQWIADAIYVCLALMWLVPDSRIESRLHE